MFIAGSGAPGSGNRLRELEGASMVHWKPYAEVLPRVEYRITKLGRSLMPLLFQLADWVAQHRVDLSQTDRQTGSICHRAANVTPC